MRDSGKQQSIVFDAETTEVLVRRRSKKTFRAPFSVIGPMTNIKFARRAMHEDVFDRLAKVSRGAVGLFRDLKYNRNVDSNLVNHRPDPSLTRTQKETLSRKFKELKQVGLIRSVHGTLTSKDGIRSFKMRRGSYIINPEMIRCLDHDEAEHLWGQCADEESADGNPDQQDAVDEE